MAPFDYHTWGNQQSLRWHNNVVDTFAPEKGETSPYLTETRVIYFRSGNEDNWRAVRINRAKPPGHKISCMFSAAFNSQYLIHSVLFPVWFAQKRHACLAWYPVGASMYKVLSRSRLSRFCQMARVPLSVCVVSSVWSLVTKTSDINHFLQCKQINFECLLY